MRNPPDAIIIQGILVAYFGLPFLQFLEEVHLHDS